MQTRELWRDLAESAENLIGAKADSVRGLSTGAPAARFVRGGVVTQGLASDSTRAGLKPLLGSPPSTGERAPRNPSE